MSRSEFAKATKKAAFARCCRPDGIPKCEECGQLLRAGRFQYDHDKADGLGGDNSLENCMVLCSGSKTSCHSLKTEQHDKPLMQKADNMRDAHLGLTRKKVKIKQPPKTRREPRSLASNLPPLPKLSLYRDAS
ncbi:HNH endonuclease signature motif containing protein [Microvirga zambiensis]|uniref:HNH endonuclease signature motif containing protein n=1 Tax=Microvirga zambiensis TaxID=1402137 RepID=UPI00191DAED8|nr:HNH endonuclease signature motif containing protein [Microvirga zambiensis]